jgi:hypothetical protein
MQTSDIDEDDDDDDDPGFSGSNYQKLHALPFYSVLPAHRQAEVYFSYMF